MIGLLPMALEVDGVEYEINTDYRDVLDLFEMLNDPSTGATAKILNMIDGLFYPNCPSDTAEAQKKAAWFLDVGGVSEADGGAKKPKVIDYKQDEQFIFAAVNALVGYDVRSLDYMHWWTFYGLCQSISQDSLIMHIMNIRGKMAKCEKLEKHERKFYNENKYMIDLRRDDAARDIIMQALRGE